MPITGIFQPHLYSRTQDFATGFAQSLDMLDKVYLLDIYPAREKPIPGVDSQLIAKQMKKQAPILTKTSAIELCDDDIQGVLLTIGAGDIDKLVAPIAEKLAKKHNT
jgi:UDP-N-acetylmuramate--alanine ligase